MLRAKILLVALAIILVTSLFLICPRPGSSTSSLRRVTNTAEQVVNLNPWLADEGTIVAFESTADLAATGSDPGFHTVRFDLSLDNASFVEIAKSRGITPSLSHDGSKAVFASTEDLLGQNPDRNSEIYLVEGSRLAQITRTVPGSQTTRIFEGNSGPSLSSNGRFIAFASNRDLVGLNSDLNCEVFLYDLVTESFSQLTNTTLSLGSLSAKVSGDGSRIFFVRRETELSETADLMFLDRSDGAVRTLVLGAKNLSLGSSRALSNDGLRIVYSADIAANQSQVFLFDIRENSPRQLTTLPQTTTDVSLQPTISGDGKRVAFATRRRVRSSSDGSVELYVLDLPTGQVEQVTNAPSSATAEVVSSLNFDGSLVTFNFPRVLSGPVTSSDFANNSEIYVATAAVRPLFGAAVALNAAAMGNEPATVKTLAPESIVTIKGTALAFVTQRATVDMNGSLPLSLAGTTASVNGQPAQLLNVSPTELTLVLPAELTDGPAEILITNAEGFQTKAPIVISHTAPGVFTVSGDGTGAGIILESDKLLAAPFDPTNGHLRLSIFATGLRHANQVSASLNEESMAVENNLPSATLAGLDEIHIAVPASFRGAGVVSLKLMADGVVSNSVNVTFGGSVLRDVMVNEFLADPPDGLAGDANHDGVRDASADEFVELVNASGRDLDLNGFQLLTRSATSSVETVRHRFTRTILPSGTAIVIFGGGRPDTANPVFGGAQIVKASSGSLSLNNSGVTITLEDANSVTVTSITYGAAVGLPSGENQSLTRAPDIDGPFVLHTLAQGANAVRFSPGTRTDSSPFLPVPSISSITIAPLFAELRIGDQLQFSARAFGENDAELAGVLFGWTSSNQSVLTIDEIGMARAIGSGRAQVFASARGVRSGFAQTTVAPGTP
ncbi:MAG TPA: lamin tail domain-containing protein, partial [Pyrinomonadaceae bacterium]|nr:lamin tail domain-containing protein [Pyrinomonadaceae bacterium]